MAAAISSLRAVGLEPRFYFQWNIFALTFWFLSPIRKEFLSMYPLETGKKGTKETVIYLDLDGRAVRVCLTLSSCNCRIDETVHPGHIC